MYLEIIIQNISFQPFDYDGDAEASERESVQSAVPAQNRKHYKKRKGSRNSPTQASQKRRKVSTYKKLMYKISDKSQN